MFADSRRPTADRCARRGPVLSARRCCAPALSHESFKRERAIARNKHQNTFAKRQREQDKKRKAEDKLSRRARKKDATGVAQNGTTQAETNQEAADA
jgi:hypothetical protein